MTGSQKTIVSLSTALRMATKIYFTPKFYVMGKAIKKITVRHNVPDDVFNTIKILHLVQLTVCKRLFYLFYLVSRNANIHEVFHILLRLSFITLDARLFRFP